ncbi:MAG: 50S ribosomal protein L13 [Gammaproteobacteria bacterium]|nr:50S ribosomal protein L13 [Gammaproteobacteria bacterium]
MRTASVRREDVVRDWLVVDASQHNLGRLASAIAVRLRGKHKAIYTPHVDTGDYVVVVNAERVRVTGRKETDKLYHRHSGFPGGLKTRSLRDMRERYPEEVIRLAVKRMLPRNPLGRDMLRKLKVYRGPEHPHGAQLPKELEL